MSDSKSSFVMDDASNRDRRRRINKSTTDNTWIWIVASIGVALISTLVIWFQSKAKPTSNKKPKDPKPSPEPKDPEQEDPEQEDPDQEDPDQEDPDQQNPDRKNPDTPNNGDRFTRCATPYQTLNLDQKTCTAKCVDQYGQIIPPRKDGTCPLILGSPSDDLVQAQPPSSCLDNAKPSTRFPGLCEKVKWYANMPPSTVYSNAGTCRDDEWLMPKRFDVGEDGIVERNVCVKCRPDAVVDPDQPQQCRPVTCPPQTDFDPNHRACVPKSDLSAIKSDKEPVVCPYGSFETKDGSCYAYCRDANNQLQPHDQLQLKDGRTINVCQPLRIDAQTSKPTCPIGSRLFDPYCIPQYVNKV